MDRECEILRKSHSLVRCAKVAMLLLSLKQSPDLNCRNTNAIYYETQEELLMKTMLEDLRTELLLQCGEVVRSTATCSADGTTTLRLELQFGNGIQIH